MDLTDTIAPTSDQLDAVDLLSGPRTFTIEKVSAGKDDQPVNIRLAEFPRVWRPGKSMRRVLVACWGPDASKYAGRRVTLYCDPEVRFGGQAVGGTRISHLSHLEKKKQVPLLVARGKSAIFVVLPLVETAEERVAEFKREWKTASPERRKVIKEQVDALTAPRSPSSTPVAEETRPEPEPEVPTAKDEVDPEEFEREDVEPDDPTLPDDPDLFADDEQEGAAQ